MLDLRLPDHEGTSLVETPLMHETAQKTLLAVRAGGLAVWVGHSRIGKTSTAQWLQRRLEKEHELEPADVNRFRALYFQVGEVRSNSGNQQRQGLRSLYTQVTKVPLPQSMYKSYSVEALAEVIVRVIVRKRIRLVLVDEAGCLSQDAMRGMVLTSDVAKALGWNLSVGFIGMDDLPIKVDQLPQISGRVHAWCYFAEYGLEDTAKLLSHLHSHFRGSSAALCEEVEFIHKTIGGFPGKIVPFLNHVDMRAMELEQGIDLAVLHVAHECIKRDKGRSIEDAKRGYRVSVGKPEGVRPVRQAISAGRK